MADNMDMEAWFAEKQRQMPKFEPDPLFAEGQRQRPRFEPDFLREFPPLYQMSQATADIYAEAQMSHAERIMRAVNENNQ